MTKKAWWQTSDYTVDTVFPEDAGFEVSPFGPAYVRVHPKRSGGAYTQRGWGLRDRDGNPSFIPRLVGGEFSLSHALLSPSLPFALVMRSVNAICIDIDGKNGGIEGVKRLGWLPPTLAETSKSGTGYHLFYSTPWDTWDVDTGFGGVPDQINIAPGVDLRAVGCVYHYSQQRWNDLSLTEAPRHLRELLQAVQRRRVEHIRRVEEAQAGDPIDNLLRAEAVVADLARSIPEGRRNSTLYAIGLELKQLSYPGWEQLVEGRGQELGLPGLEIEQLVRNINSYN